MSGRPQRNAYLAIWNIGNRGSFSPLPSQGSQSGTSTNAQGVPLFISYHQIAAPRQQFALLWDSSDVPPGTYPLTATIYDANYYYDRNKNDPRSAFNQAFADFTNDPPRFQHLGEPEAVFTANVKVVDVPSQQVTVQMQRALSPSTEDQALWTAIRRSASALSFNNYNNFMDVVLCGADPATINLDPALLKATRDPIKHRLRLPFPDTDAYRQLKVATEVFVMLNCGVSVTDPGLAEYFDEHPEQLDGERRRYYRAVGPGDIEQLWQELINDAEAITPGLPTLPYLAIIRRKLGDVALVSPQNPNIQAEEAATACLGILLRKLTNPCLLELIWSYWHEEGMLVQTMNAITWRFQNRRGPGDRDPLAMLEIDPLRPLNNFIWGYIQDEQHRLTVPRRAYEYDHHYGLTLLGKAVPTLRGADSRSRFLEAFHNLLFLCSIFYKEDDDTTVAADGFPVLNALKEVHLLLTQGAHNQYGDLPWTARQEMLMQEWLLARPEFREFLPSRVMVDYPEPWMDRVETMKTLQSWTNTSILHFRDLGVFGEQILLGIRFGAWPSVIEPQFAANWARYWRPEIQGYIHAYRAVTAVDLSERADATPPSLLLQQRLQGMTYDSAALPPGRERLVLPQGKIARRGVPRLR
jgi:hypothetical protein